MPVWRLGVLLFLCCCTFSAVLAYPDRKTMQIVRQLLDRVKDIDEVHIVEAKFLSDYETNNHSKGPDQQNGLEDPEGAASFASQVTAKNRPNEQLMFVNIGTILGKPHLGVVEVPLGSSGNKNQEPRWIPPSHSAAESQRLSFVAAPTQNVNPRNHTNFRPQPSWQHQGIDDPQQHLRMLQQSRQQPPKLAQPHIQFPVVILSPVLASNIAPAQAQRSNSVYTGLPSRLLDNRPPAINVVPELKPTSVKIPAAIAPYGTQAWVSVALPSEDASEFSNTPTLTAHSVHRSPMASVRRLFGRQDEESIVASAPRKSFQRLGGRPSTATLGAVAEESNARKSIRRKLFSRGTRKPSRRLLFQYLG